MWEDSMVHEALSLKGRTVAITRPRDQAEEVAELIRRRGGKPYFMPTIEVKVPCDLAPIKKFIVELDKGQIDYVIFMSVNGVRFLFNAAEKLGQLDNLREHISETLIAAVGPRTAKELGNHHIHVSFIPPKYTSDGIVESLQKIGVRDKSIRIPRTSAASPTLTEKLRALGGLVEEVHVYDSAMPANNSLATKFFSNLAAGKIHAIIFGSSLCAKNLLRMLDKQGSKEKLIELMNTKATIVAIGPVTANTLKTLGVKVDAMPIKHTFEEAVTALALL